MRRESLALAVSLAACSSRHESRELIAPPSSPKGSPASVFRIACATAISCVPAARQSISECATRRTEALGIYRRRDLSDEEVACLVQAGGDCAIAARCLGAVPDAAPCERPGASSCEGGIARGCHHGLFVETEEQCSAPESCVKCMSRERCCARRCIRDERQQCVDGALSRCDGDALAIGPRCTDFGMACADHPTAVSDCVGPGKACSPNLSARCEGRNLVSCYSGHELSVPCENIGGRICVSWLDDLGVSRARCMVDEQACQLNQERCVGDSVQFCDSGAVVELSCRAMGFAGCIHANGRARCSRN